MSWHAQIRYNTLLAFLLVAVIVWIRDGKFWPRKIFENKWQVWGFLAILAIGILTRTLFLNTYPPPEGNFMEEVQVGSFINFPLDSLFSEPAIRYLGASMFNLRLPFVLLSYLSILFFYIACRLFLKTYFGAIFATGLFATSSILATTSRLAIEWFTPMTIFSLALAGIFYACTRRDWAAFAIAGLTMGFTILEYQVYKFAAVLCIIWFCSYFFTKGAPYCNATSRYRFAHIKPMIPKILLFFLIVSVTFLPEFIPGDRFGPFGWFLEGYVRHRNDIASSRPNFTQNQIITNDLNKMHRMINSVFLSDDWGMTFFERSMVDYFTGLLGVVAFIYCILFIRQSHAKLFPLIIPVGLAAAGFLSINPSVKYAVPLIPLYFLTIGIFIDDIGQIFGRNKIVIWTLIILLVALMTFNSHHFFIVELKDNYRIVSEQFYDLKVILADQIALFQQKNKQDSINVLSDQWLFGQVNDYTWLYDFSRMKYLSTEEQLSNTTGYVLANDKYITMVKKFSSPEKCKQWKTQFDKNEIILCELNPRLNSTHELSVKNVSG